MNKSMLMNNFKRIEKTMNTQEMLQFVEGQMYLYEKEFGSLPDYFGKILQVSTNNSKTCFPTVNNPSLVTCLIGLECNQFCYACNGYYKMDSVEIPRLSNLYLYLTDKESYRTQLKLEMLKSKIIRVNDSGDLTDYEFTEMIIDLAIETKCNLQVFTKKHFLVNKYCKIHHVNNYKLEKMGVTIIFSHDKKIKNLVNPYGFKVAKVIKDGINGQKKNGLYVCNAGKCLKCFLEKKGCFDPSVSVIGLVVHAVSKATKEELFK